MFAHLARFPGPLLERMARACEYSQAKTFDYHSHSRPEGLSRPFPGNWMNYFRLAQKFRDEHGSQRLHPAPDCFHCFGDIVQLEKIIEDHDDVGLTVQCAALGVIDSRHFSHLYEWTWNFAQLSTVHEILERLDDMDELFNSRLENPEDNGEDEQPAWRNL